jgi:SAM-dependent methyltransferase
MLLYALDPEKHADAENYKYNNDPEQVRHLWMGQRWFRRTLEDIRMSRVEKEDFVEIELHREEAEAYFNLWKECAYTGFKLSKLQRMLIDEEYSAKVGAGRLAKLEKLDSIVAEAAVKGQKVVIWTPWVSGVIDGLQDRYGEHGAVKIDGRTESAVQRYRIAKAFKSSPLVNVMIISKVADEAIDLSCGDKGVVLVRLVPPITPREDIQTIGRVNRRTQAGLVRVLTLVGKSELLKGRMQAFASEELSELGLSPPSYFLAQTIDKDVELLLKWKRAITEKVFRGEKLSQNEMSRWGVTTIAQAKHYLNSSLYSSTKDTPPFIRAIFIDQNLRNAGAEDVAKAMDGKIGRAYAKLYEEGWESSHSQHTLRLIKRLMEPGMTDGQAPKVIDLGGAAGYSSRVLGIGTTIVDLNPHFIKKGEEICSSLGIRNRFVRGDMRNTGEAEGSYDVAIASYSLHHLKQTEEERQVEETLLEMNRILKEDGRVFIAFPWSAGEDSLQRFAKGLPLYGFMVTGSSGVYYPVFDDDKRGKKILLLEARKVAEARGLSPKVNWNSFIVYSEQSRMGFASDREKKERVKKKDNEKKRLRDFRKVRGIIT